MKGFLVLLLMLVLVVPLMGQDSESGGPFGVHQANVYNRPVYSRGLKLYKDYSMQLRDSNLKIYSPSSGYAATTGVFLFGQADTSSFTTTETVDTVLVSGVERTSMFLLTAKGASVDQQDVLQYVCTDDTLFVYRLASGASGLVYVYMQVK